MEKPFPPLLLAFAPVKKYVWKMLNYIWVTATNSKGEGNQWDFDVLR